MRGIIIGVPAALILWALGYFLWNTLPIFLTFFMLVLLHV